MGPARRGACRWQHRREHGTAGWDKEAEFWGHEGVLAFILPTIHVYDISSYTNGSNSLGSNINGRTQPQTDYAIGALPKDGVPLYVNYGYNFLVPCFLRRICQLFDIKFLSMNGYDYEWGGELVENSTPPLSCNWETGEACCFLNMLIKDKDSVIAKVLGAAHRHWQVLLNEKWVPSCRRLPPHTQYARNSV